jgi:hypothetical protein
MFGWKQNVLNAGSLALALFGIGLSAAATAADDDEAIARSSRLIRETTVAPANFEYRPALSANTAGRWESDPVAGVEFSNGGALQKLTSIRYLSFLTMAEFRHSHLFFGVNEDGIVGVHLTGSSKGQNQRFLELARLPNLDR